MQIAYITPRPPTTSPNLLDDPKQNALGGSYQMIPQNTWTAEAGDKNYRPRLVALEVYDQICHGQLKGVHIIPRYLPRPLSILIWLWPYGLALD